MTDTYRYRVKFSKTGALRWLSHLEVARAIMRAFRRAGIPVVHSQGFTPHPRISFGTVLPVGVAGRDEFFDAQLEEPLDLSALRDRLNENLPWGMRIEEVTKLQGKLPGLMSLITDAEYLLDIQASGVTAVELRDRVMGMLVLTGGPNNDRSEWGACFSVDCELLGAEQVRLRVHTNIRQKPSRLVAELEEMIPFALKVINVERVCVWVKSEGELISPTNVAVIGGNIGETEGNPGIGR